MLTPAMGAAMIGPMSSLRENGAQHGFRGFHLRLSSLQGSSHTHHPQEREQSNEHIIFFDKSIILAG